MKILIISLIFSSLAFSQSYEEFDAEKDVLSMKYFAGSYLQYDCDDKHFVCTDEIEFKRCSRNRDEEILFKKFNYSCAPLKKFSSKAECLKNLKSLVNRGQSGFAMCIDPKKISSAIRF